MRPRRAPRGALAAASAAAALAVWVFLDRPAVVDGRAILAAAIAGGLVVWLAAQRGPAR